MRQQSSAIPIEVLRKVTYKPVSKEYEEKPVYADGNSILKRVKPKLKKPWRELNKEQRRWWKDEMHEYGKAEEEALKMGDFYRFKDYIIRHFRSRYLRKLNVQDMARMYHSTGISMGMEFNKFVEIFRPAWVFRKIGLSSWHWGRLESATYNQCADVYNKLVKFDIDIKDFKVEVDTSSGCNQKGYSRYTRTYLDGELAYIIYYKDKHVLTVSFNAILGNSKVIQIRQIQCKDRKGNRWMYKLPKNYVEFIIDKFFNIFDGYEIHLIRSETVVDEVSGGYMKLIEREVEYAIDKAAKGNKDQFYQMSIRDMNKAMDMLFKFDAVDAHRMKSIYSGVLDGYKRVKTDRKGHCSVLAKK